MGAPRVRQRRRLPRASLLSLGRRLVSAPQRETLACELEANDPDVAFDPSVVDTCTFPADCSTALGTGSAGTSPPLCLPPGKAPNGAPCVWSQACQSGNCTYTYDLNNVKSACGRCETPVPCPCPVGQECVVDDGGPTCATEPNVGEACGAPLFSCLDSECVMADGASSGTCENRHRRPRRALLQSLDRTGVPGLDPEFCDSTSHCRAYEAADYGQPCAGTLGAEGALCIGGGKCDYADTQICVPPAPDGVPCDEAQGLTCLPPARCLSHACVFPSLATCASR